MIRLDKLTDYAVVVLARLSALGGAQPHSAAHLAAATGLPEPTVAKVLKKLSKHGLVQSVRGAGGGYRALRPAAEVSVAEVVSALEGPIAIASCVTDGDHSCGSARQCPSRGGWDRANALVRAALESVKLSDMAPPPCGKVYEFFDQREGRA